MRAPILAAALALCAPPAAAQTSAPYMDFRGRMLLALSDADMLASAYVDGRLGPREPGSEDALSVIPLAGGVPGAPVVVPVSNAVTAWPSNLAVSPDGRWAFVAELQGRPPAGATRMADLPPGPRLTVVDLRDPARPRVSSVRDLGAATVAAAVHPSGDLLVVTLRGDSTRHAALIPVRDGVPGEPHFVRFPGADGEPPHVAWHPDGRILATTYPTDDVVRFYEVDRSGAAPVVRPWGDAVPVGQEAGVGHFTPDGRHFVVTGLYWGPHIEGGFLGPRMSVLTVVRVAAGGERPEHRVVSAAPVGASAEELAISPDGRWVVSLNMEASFLPEGHPRLARYSTLTLLSLDERTGQLAPRGTFPFEGILPEGITFDASGRFLAVASFDHWNPARRGTTVDVWRLVEGASPLLVKTDVAIPVARGAHIVKLVP